MRVTQCCVFLQPKSLHSKTVPGVHDNTEFLEDNLRVLSGVLMEKSTRLIYVLNDKTAAR